MTMKSLILAAIAWLAALPALALCPATPEAWVAGGVAMVPLRPVAELLGAQLDLDAQGCPRVRRAGQELVFRERAATVTRNGQGVTLPRAPFVTSGLTYVPLRALGEGLGGTLASEGGRLRLTLPEAPTLLFPMVSGTPTEESARYTAELYAVDTDGTGLRRLTYTHCENTAPAFSPDGTRMVYTRDGHLYLRGTDDPNETLLWPAADGGAYHSAVFMPDGKSVLYVKTPPDGITSEQIFRINIDGTGKQYLADGTAPCPSPDGTRIAYSYQMVDEALRTIVFEVRIISADGTRQQTISNADGACFSPDGSRLLYSRLVDRTFQSYWQTAVYRLRDGKELAYTGNGRLSLSNQYSPSFSPDGKHVLCVSGGLTLLSFDGERPQELTVGGVIVRPVFSPDGAWIAFQQCHNRLTIEPDGADGPAEMRPSGLILTSPDLHIARWLTSPAPADAVAVGDLTFTPDSRSVLFVASGVVRPAPPCPVAALATQAELDAWVRELLPKVEQAMGRKFVHAPACRIASFLEAQSGSEGAWQVWESRPWLSWDRAKVLAAQLQERDEPDGFVAGFCTNGDEVCLTDVLFDRLMASDRSLEDQRGELQDTLAHELAHALQFQTGELARASTHVRGSEGQQIFTAVMEGQAGVAGEEAATACGRTAAYQGKLQAMRNREYPAHRFPALWEGPNLAAAMVFPYLNGRTFMRARRDAGGTEALWQVMRECPTSISTIYHPETYGQPGEATPESAPLLNGLEEKFGDLPWQSTGCQVNEMGLRSTYARLPGTLRDGLFARLTRVETRGLLAAHMQAAVTLYVARDAALWREFVPAAESIHQGALERDDRAPIVDERFTALPGVSGDIVRVQRYREAFTTRPARPRIIARVARGPVLVEVSTMDLPLTDKQLADIIHEVFSRLDAGREKERAAKSE